MPRSDHSFHHSAMYSSFLSLIVIFHVPLFMSIVCLTENSVPVVVILVFAWRVCHSC